MESNKARIPILTNRKQFADWAESFTSFMVILDLDIHLTTTASESPKAEEQKKRNKVLAYLRLAVHDKLRTCFKSATDPKVAWDKLNLAYSRKKFANQLNARSAYLAVKMPAHDTTLTPHYEHMEELLKVCADVGQDITDQEKLTVMIQSLNKDFSSLRIQLLTLPGESRTLNKIEEIYASVMDDEQQASEFEQDATAALALNHDVHKKEQKYQDKKYCNHCSRSGHRDDECLKKKGITCYNCNKLGHYQNDCRRPKNQEPRYDKDKNYGMSLFPSEHSLASLSQDTQRDTCLWIADSGASQHATPDSSSMSNYRPWKSQEGVQTADGKVLRIAGTGDIAVRHEINGTNFYTTLRDVLHVPEIAVNLFSISRTCNVVSGRSINFYREKMLIVENKKTICKGNKIGRLYFLKFTPTNDGNSAKSVADNESTTIKITDDRQLSAFTINSTILWHQRLGHLNFDYMKRLQNMTIGMEAVNLTKPPPCDMCARVNTKRAVLTGTRRRAEQIGEIIHSDVYGKYDVESMGGKRYHVVFLDDHSSFVQIYFIRKKDEVFSCYKVFEKWLNTQTNHVIRLLRADGGGEYISTEFKEHLSGQGTVLETTPRNTPELNARAERRHQIIINRIRAMLHASGLPRFMWAEAGCCASHLINRSPTANLDGMTPYEVIYKRKPNLSYLKIFGSTANVHVDRNLRKKLDRHPSRGAWLATRYSQEDIGFTFRQSALSSRPVTCGSTRSPTTRATRMRSKTQNPIQSVQTIIMIFSS
jgi:hypothetical protein